MVKAGSGGRGSPWRRTLQGKGWRGRIPRGGEDKREKRGQIHWYLEMWSDSIRRAIETVEDRPFSIQP